MDGSSAVESSATGQAPRAEGAPRIKVRAMGFPFRESGIPRHWFMGSAHLTALSNALQLLFPAGERFFIRSVKHYEGQITDPELKARIKAFYGQEGRHGHEHERFFKVLEEQGFDVKSFLAWYEELAYEKLEKRFSPAMRLSVTAALEHFTAAMGRNALTSDFLDQAHPILADLMRWHAAEEIEHKSVAFDVFEAVDGRYPVRVAGLFLALVGLTRFWAEGTRHFLREEEKLGTDLRAAAKAARENPRLQEEKRRRGEMFRHAILEYLKPGFHPDDIDDYELARSYLESIGRLEG
ncbi:MAG: metal-dependent hydrolase [Sandaracinaceae bacterium]|nr:metal-dependent hydrolase [Sandaracinaceae bacterium]